jgi:hypothetical protein
MVTDESLSIYHCDYMIFMRKHTFLAGVLARVAAASLGVSAAALRVETAALQVA